MKNWFKPILILAPSFAILCACAKPQGAPEPGPTEQPQPPPRPQEILWGDLSCQKQARCRNPILNERFDRVVYFFHRYFPRPFEAGGEEFKTYQCARFTWSAFDEYFGLPLEPSDADFFLSVIDPKNCSVGDSVEIDLMNYFSKTEEYKNEFP